MGRTHEWDRTSGGSLKCLSLKGHAVQRDFRPPMFLIIQIMTTNAGRKSRWAVSLNVESQNV